MQKPDQNQTNELVGQIVYQVQRFPTFYVIVKETPHTVMLQPIQSIETPIPIYGQCGTEVSALIDGKVLKYDDPKAILRAKKHKPDFPGDHLWFSHKRSAFFLWNGEPRPFDNM